MEFPSMTIMPAIPHTSETVMKVATMKLSVASFHLATSLVLLAAITSAQTSHKTATKTHAQTAVAAGTLRICRGVALPAGYIIVGYMTTSACPHGAYLLKKDTESQASRTDNKDADTESQSSITPGKKPDSQSRKNQDNETRNSVALNRPIRSPAKASPEASQPVSRPRRVGATQPENEAPFLRGVEPKPAPGPPTLAGMPTTSPVAASAEPVSASKTEAAGPEEVSEGD